MSDCCYANLMARNEAFEPTRSSMPSPFGHFASLQSSFSCHLSSTNIAVFPANSLEDFFLKKFQDSSASTFRSTKGGLGSNRTGQVGRLYLWDFGAMKKSPSGCELAPCHQRKYGAQRFEPCCFSRERRS